MTLTPSHRLLANQARGRRLGARSAAAAAAACVLALTLATPAHAALTWSGPFAVDPEAGDVVTLPLACPSTTQCTLVDGEWGPAGLFQPGVEITFNPRSPSAPTPVMLDENGISGGVACPSPTQCTTVSTGDEITFNPQSPGTPTPVTIDAAGSIGGSLDSVACPSATQCTAVGLAGEEVTFNPQSPGSPTQATVDNRLDSVACPSATLCAAVGPYGSAGTEGDLATFDPGSPGSPALAKFGGFAPYRVACPSTSRCMAVGLGGPNYGYNGLAATFDPRSPGSPTPAAIGLPRHGLTDVACPSASFCVALDNLGDVLEGKPGKPGSFKATLLPKFEPLTEVSAIACPSVTECVADDYLGDVWVGISGATVSGALAGIGQGHPKLTLNVGAGGKVFQVTVALPRGLSFNQQPFSTPKKSARAARASARRRSRTVRGLSVSGGKLRSAKLRHGKLAIRLKKPARRVRIKTGGKLISASRALRRKARKGKVKQLEITVTVVGAHKHRTTQQVELKAR
jgi:hypothetical protein